MFKQTIEFFLLGMQLFRSKNNFLSLKNNL